MDKIKNAGATADWTGKPPVKLRWEGASARAVPVLKVLVADWNKWTAGKAIGWTEQEGGGWAARWYGARQLGEEDGGRELQLLHLNIRTPARKVGRTPSSRS